VTPSIISLPPGPLGTPRTYSVAIQNNSRNPLSVTDACLSWMTAESGFVFLENGEMPLVFRHFPLIEKLK
jgi:hypothetical protein